VLPPAKSALSRLSTGASGRIPKLARGVALAMTLPSTGAVRAQGRDFDFLIAGGGIYGLCHGKPAREPAAGRTGTGGHRRRTARSLRRFRPLLLISDWDLRVFA